MCGHVVPLQFLELVLGSENCWIPELWIKAKQDIQTNFIAISSFDTILVILGSEMNMDEAAEHKL